MADLHQGCGGGAHGAFARRLRWAPQLQRPPAHVFLIRGRTVEASQTPDNAASLLTMPHPAAAQFVLLSPPRVSPLPAAASKYALRGFCKSAYEVGVWVGG